MNVKYKIGDRVRLKTSSQYYPHQSNGKDGTITEWNRDIYHQTYPSGHDINHPDDTHYFHIDWDNGNGNCYRIYDIEPAVSTVTRIPIPEVDMYIAVTDPNWPGVMYVQVTRGFSMESDNCLRGYGNLITFEKSVEFDSRVSIYSEQHNRRFLPMSNREIVWMNHCLSSHSYTSYDSWKPSADDLLKIEVLDRYPNLKVGEEFGFVAGQKVKSVHPRNWTIFYHDEIYLAVEGDGGAKVFENGIWADRSGYKDVSKVDSEFNSSSWCVACTHTGDGQDELRQWRLSPWCGKGYIDNTGYWTEDKPLDKHLISYQTFLDKVYYPSKGIKPPPSVVIKESAVTSSTTHLPYLNIGTKEKKSTSFIENVDEIRVTKKVSKKPKRLTI